MGDEYSRKVIKLLLERDRAYLSRLLGVAVPENATVDAICTIIADRDRAPEKDHVSSIYRCRCGSKRVVLREAQMRSADEGSTIVRVCIECGNKW